MNTRKSSKGEEQMLSLEGVRELPRLVKEGKLSKEDAKRMIENYIQLKLDNIERFETRLKEMKKEITEAIAVASELGIRKLNLNGRVLVWC